jgi:hypothetical protein
MIARILALLLIAVSVVPALAQDKDDKQPEQKVPRELPAKGTELFRGLLHFHKIKPLREGEASRSAGPAQTVLFIHGLPQTREQLLIIRQYANSALTIIASGEQYTPSDLAPRVLHDYDVATPGLICPTKHLTPESLHQSQWRDCPFVKSTPFDWTSLQGDTTPAWNPFRGLGQIATRSPASLRKYRNPGSFVPLAFLPNSCVDRNGEPLPAGQPFAVGTLDRVRGYQPAIILADEDFLSNQMIALPDTDNLPFAMKLIKSFNHFLDESKGETYCVYFEYGERKDRFDDVTFSAKPSPGMPPLPIPPPEMIDKLGTQVADGLADQFDRSDAANSIFNRNERYYAYLLRLLVLALAGMAIFYFARRAFISRYRNERTAMPIAPLARVKPAKGLVGQMRQDILIGGDYGPVIREYLRELFAATGLRVGSDEKAPAGLPPIQYDGRVENTPALIADLTKLWRTAYGPAGRIPLSAWKELEPMMLRVWRAAEAGRWRFAADPRGAA